MALPKEPTACTCGQRGSHATSGPCSAFARRNRGSHPESVAGTGVRNGRGGRLMVALDRPEDLMHRLTVRPVRDMPISRFGERRDACVPVVRGLTLSSSRLVVLCRMRSLRVVLVIALLGLLVSAVPIVVRTPSAAADTVFAVVTRSVTVSNGDRALPTSLYLPAGGPRAWPAVVFAHGYNNDPRRMTCCCERGPRRATSLPRRRRRASTRGSARSAPRISPTRPAT